MPTDRSAGGRIADWKEFHHHLPEADLKKRARAAWIADPFCHTGQLVSGMASGCPIHDLIPEWNDLVFRGLWKEALERLHKTNNFQNSPDAYAPRRAKARAFSESTCRPSRSRTSSVEIIDHGWSMAGSNPNRRRSAPARTVAVIGSGPAGISAAAQLNQAGHLVTVFERADRPGGMLMYGIPNVKLEKNEVCCAASESVSKRRREICLATRRSAGIIRRKIC